MSNGADSSKKNNLENSQMIKWNLSRKSYLKASFKSVLIQSLVSLPPSPYKVFSISATKYNIADRMCTPSRISSSPVFSNTGYQKKVKLFEGENFSKASCQNRYFVIFL